MEECLFCKIIKKEIPCYKVYEDDICISFLDISQQTLGHLLVLPKTHYNNILDIDSEVLAHLSKVVQKIAKSLINVNGIKGFNIVNNCNEVSGQSIMHFHIHLVPRYDDKEFIMKGANPKDLSKEEFMDLQNKIIKAIK